MIGVYPLLTNGTCRFLAYDFDNHKKGAEKKDFANDDDTWIEEVEAMRKICVLNGIDPLVERSRTGRIGNSLYPAGSEKRELAKEQSVMQ